MAGDSTQLFTTGNEICDHEQHHQFPSPVRPGIRFSTHRRNAQCQQRCFVAAAASPSHCSHSATRSSLSVTIPTLVFMKVILAPPAPSRAFYRAASSTPVLL